MNFQPPRVLTKVLALFSVLCLGLLALQASEQVESLNTKSIHISLKKQTLIAYLANQPIYSFKCSTGKNNTTPPGSWLIKEKVRHNRSLPKYGSVPIPFSLRLNVIVGNRAPRIAIHAHSSVPEYPASHGCIRLKYTEAETLFSWASVGTPVIIK